jgi:hypothetical protein
MLLNVSGVVGVKLQVDLIINIVTRPKFRRVISFKPLPPYPYK